MISQFGWQAEKAFYRSDSGVAAVTEWVVLMGGLEADLKIPSMTWLVGMRSANGAEFGIGPNFSPAGSALAIAAGVTFRHGYLNVPVNVAIVPSKNGTRISMLTGFNMRRTITRSARGSRARQKQSTTASRTSRSRTLAYLAFRS